MSRPALSWRQPKGALELQEQRLATFAMNQKWDDARRDPHVQSRVRRDS